MWSEPTRSEPIQTTSRGVRSAVLVIMGTKQENPSGDQITDSVRAGSVCIYRSRRQTREEVVVTFGRELAILQRVVKLERYSSQRQTRALCSTTTLVTLLQSPGVGGDDDFFVDQRYPRSRFMAQTMPPGSRSGSLQLRSAGKVARPT